jgi:prepilin-type N-terminal cleavage/methylation domain-containing protein
MSATGKRRPAGFTLVEMLVTLSVAGMISALAFPRLTQSLETLRARQTMAELVALTAQARADARLTGRTVEIWAESGSGATARLRLDAQRFVELPPAALAQAQNDLPLRFFSDGGASGAVLNLPMERRIINLTVDPATGGVRALLR